jgi:hypothetical protein
MDLLDEYTRLVTSLENSSVAYAARRDQDLVDIKNLEAVDNDQS